MSNEAAGDLVVMVVAAIPPSHSGIGAQALLLARELLAQGQPTIVLTHRHRGRRDRHGVPIRHIGWGYPRRPLPAALFGLEAALWLLRNKRTIRAVHLHGGGVGPTSVGVAAHLLGLPAIYKVTRLGDDDPLAAARRRAGRVRSWVISRARRVIATSPAIRDTCLEAGIEPARIAEIPNGVDLARFLPADAEARRNARRSLGLPADALLALYVGYVDARKRTSELIEFWSAVAGSRDILCLVGPIITPTSAADPRVRILGSVPDPSAYYRAADVFVFLSGEEGLPNAVLEAQASGLPAILSPLPGVHDYIVKSGESGIVLADISLEAFATAWQAVRDPEFRTVLGAAARRNAERFDIRAVACSYRDLYRECVGE